MVAQHLKLNLRFQGVEGDELQGEFPPRLPLHLREEAPLDAELPNHWRRGNFASMSFPAQVLLISEMSIEAPFYSTIVWTWSGRRVGRGGFDLCG